MKDNKIDKIFVNKLAQHSVKPSADAWKRIDGQLGGGKDKPVIWWKLPLLVLLLISFGLGAYSFHNYFESENVRRLTSSYEASRYLELVGNQSVSGNDSNKNLKQLVGIGNFESVGIEKQLESKNKLAKVEAIVGSEKKQPKTYITERLEKSKKKKFVSANDDGKITNADSGEKSSREIPISDENIPLFEPIETELKSRKVNLEIQPDSFPSTVEKEKKFKIKVEITIPPKRKDRNNKKGGDQETQSFAINLKSVLKNVLSN